MGRPHPDQGISHFYGWPEPYIYNVYTAFLAGMFLSKNRSYNVYMVPKFWLILVILLPKGGAAPNISMCRTDTINTLLNRIELCTTADCVLLCIR
jgi:hypothetical protein